MKPSAPHHTLVVLIDFPFGFDLQDDPISDGVGDTAYTMRLVDLLTSRYGLDLIHGDRLSPFFLTVMPGFDITKNSLICLTKRFLTGFSDGHISNWAEAIEARDKPRARTHSTSSVSSSTRGGKSPSHPAERGGSPIHSVPFAKFADNLVANLTSLANKPSTPNILVWTMLRPPATGVLLSPSQLSELIKHKSGRINVACQVHDYETYKEGSPERIMIQGYMRAVGPQNVLFTSKIDAEIAFEAAPSIEPKEHIVGALCCYPRALPSEEIKTDLSLVLTKSIAPLRSSGSEWGLRIIDGKELQLKDIPVTVVADLLEKEVSRLIILADSPKVSMYTELFNKTVQRAIELKNKDVKINLEKIENLITKAPLTVYQRTTFRTELRRKASKEEVRAALDAPEQSFIFVVNNGQIRDGKGFDLLPIAANIVSELATDEAFARLNQRLRDSQIVIDPALLKSTLQKIVFMAIGFHKSPEGTAALAFSPTSCPIDLFMPRNLAGIDIRNLDNFFAITNPSDFTASLLLTASRYVFRVDDRTFDTNHSGTLTAVSYGCFPIVGSCHTDFQSDVEFLIKEGAVASESSGDEKPAAAAAPVVTPTILKHRNFATDLSDYIAGIYAERGEKFVHAANAVAFIVGTEVMHEMDIKTPVPGKLEALHARISAIEQRGVKLALVGANLSEQPVTFDEPRAAAAASTIAAAAATRLGRSGAGPAPPPPRP